MYISLIAFYFCLICFYFSVCLLSDNKIQILLHRVNGCWFLYVTNIVFVNKHLLYYDFHFVASMSVYSHTQHTHMPSLALFALVTRNQSYRGNTVKVWPLKQEVRTFPSNVCYNEQLSVNYQMDVTVHTSIVCVCILNHVSVFVWTGLTLWVYHVLYIYLTYSGSHCYGTDWWFPFIHTSYWQRSVNPTWLHRTWHSTRVMRRVVFCSCVQHSWIM